MADISLDVSELWPLLPTQQKFIDGIRNAPDMGIVAYVGSFGSGKTHVLCRANIGLALQYPGIPQLLGRFHSTDLRDTTQKQFFDLIGQLDDEVARQIGHRQGPRLGEWRQTDRDFRWFNGSVTHFRPLDQAEQKYKSLTLATYGFDEADQVSLEAANVLTGRLRAKGYPRVGYMVSNPTPKNHWLYKWFVTSPLAQPTADGSQPQHYLLRTNTRENAANLPPNYIESLRDKYSPEHIRRYLDGEWGGLEGDRPVFPGFSRDIHVRECPYYKSRLVHVGVDYGFLFPAVVWTQVDPYGHFQVMRRWSPREITAEKLVQGAIARTQEWFPDATVRVYSGTDAKTTKDTNAKTSGQIWGDYGWGPRFKYSHIERGLTILRNLLVVRDDGLPGLFVDPINSLMIEGFEGGYYYPATKQLLGQSSRSDVYPDDDAVPIKDNVFAPAFEAMRYVAVNVFDTSGNTPGPQKKRAFGAAPAKSPTFKRNQARFGHHRFIQGVR